VLKGLRDVVWDVAQGHRFGESKAYDLVTAVNEAAMNAIVHAGGGVATLHESEHAIYVRIEDNGKGISEDLIPRATLERGYTTANSFGQGFKMILDTIDHAWLLTGSTGTTVVLEQCRARKDAPFALKADVSAG
jgi:anti-sigma regulatory factor (Ser/Thr protein kinase)